MIDMAALGATFLLGVGVVGTFVVKYAAKAKRAVVLLKEGMDVVESVIVAIEDKEVSAAEVNKIVEEAKQVKAAWADFVAKNG